MELKVIQNSHRKVSLLVGVLPEEPESLPTSGEMTSPNFPSDYPNDLHERKTIKVAKGNVINIHFTDLDLERPYDYVDIIDGDGTFLGHFGPRYRDEVGERQERVITSFTETVHVLFHTDDSVSLSGWRLEWSKWRFLIGVVINLISFKVLFRHRGESCQEVVT